MASLADLGGVYGTQDPTGFKLADIGLAGGLSSAQADLSKGRILRNFGQFSLPDLASSQAARGAFHSSGTRDKAGRLGLGVQDSLDDVTLGQNQYQANLAANALLAQTGISLGGA